MGGRLDGFRKYMIKRGFVGFVRIVVNHFFGAAVVPIRILRWVYRIIPVWLFGVIASYLFSYRYYRGGCPFRYWLSLFMIAFRTGFLSAIYDIL